MTIQEILATLRATLDQTSITLYPGASAQLIARFEQEMNLKLPADFNAFYTFCNGLEDEAEVFRCIPLEEILEQQQQYQPGQFAMAEYLLYGEVWEVEVPASPGADYRIFTSRYTQPVCLTHSLAEFVERYLQGGVWGPNGLVLWFEQLRKQAGRVSQ